MPSPKTMLLEFLQLSPGRNEGFACKNAIPHGSGYLEAVMVHGLGWVHLISTDRPASSRLERGASHSFSCWSCESHDQKPLHASCLWPSLHLTHEALVPNKVAYEQNRNMLLHGHAVPVGSEAGWK